MRTTLRYGDKLIVGEDLNSHCIRVSIENRNDLGHFVLDKKIEELEENELLNAGMSLIGREIETTCGTFIVIGNSITLKGKEDLGAVIIDEPNDIKDRLYNAYMEYFKPAIEKEIRKEKRAEKAEKKKAALSLFE